MGSLSRTQSSVLSSILSGSQSSYSHQHPQSQGEPSSSMAPRNPQGPSLQQSGESLISGPIHLPRGHGYSHDPYGSTPRMYHHHHHQQQHQQQHQYQHPQPQQLQGPPPPQPVQAVQFPHGCSHLQGEPFAVMAYAHQMVDMLTEENRILRQEMEVCRDKVTRLHKVMSAEVRAGSCWRACCWCGGGGSCV